MAFAAGCSDDFDIKAMGLNDSSLTDQIIFLRLERELLNLAFSVGASELHAAIGTSSNSATATPKFQFFFMAVYVLH